MEIIHHILKFSSKTKLEFIDITDDVQRFIERSKIKNGLVNVFTMHTTTSIKINEREEGFHQDFKAFIQELLPVSRNYLHDDFEKRDKSTMCNISDECANGHSHCQQMLIGTSSEHVPIIDGKMALGRWQRIFLIELDKPRKREVMVSVIGK
ncbi:hypothetical protein A2483_04030 [Candidatus Peregrinibacteria bacterium RIFOXYC2_FULL_33_13]|nr:MAG: hypothetical protein UR27_C0001G0005 [Candidatus Peregrinibacteria bacterium GW2011_GWA2_33_10]KKP39736.1 MAG: hypothetical protein UR30_C0008G0005 [Candidatus Peregrinibacteria bacterium GW2011_GWC2_33_13]OGJ50425.1 MAG: hypothetical protein A2229_02375 [Candidatus Peregrinibacteria bacterium RIFOXYA2_FULL_33_7]OGJ52733.1 MAG: hypothetical protein A2483_04030 [Candidatus Peregrinibacteria bacterium RIFOXYC2_FULL_33_13]